MKRSIRTTFIGLFIGLLAMVLLAVWAMNSFFLENYYLNDKVKDPSGYLYPDQSICKWKKAAARGKTSWMTCKVFILKTENKMRSPG